MRLPWRRKPALVYPIPPAPRTAVLVAGFRASGSVRVFDDWCEEAARFDPQSIAGTLAQLKSLPLEVRLTHAVIVIGRWEDGRLTEPGRDRLWRRFRVPLFEQVVSDAWELLAAECEAHCGLHLEFGVSPGEGLIDESPCACGRKLPRLLPKAESRAAGL